MSWAFPVISSRVKSRAVPRRFQTFCSTTYGVTFPLFEKIDVNGEHQSPIYAELEKVADAEGYSGDVRWNFEKFLVGRGRYRDAIRASGDAGGPRAGGRDRSGAALARSDRAMESHVRRSEP